MPDLNEHLKSRLVGIRSSLTAHHQGGMGMPSAAKGSERENFLREFLQQVYPSHYRFSSGAITDSSGNISGQVDIVLENPVLPSFPMPGSGSERLILAEAAATVVEVKSNLCSQWPQVEKTCQSLKKLMRNTHSQPVVYDAFMGSRPEPTSIPLIAFGYTGFRDIYSLKNRIERTSVECRPDVAVVLDSGLFWSPDGIASEELGLYALCASISKFISLSIVSSSDIHSYVKNSD